MKRDIYGHEKRYINWKESILKHGEPELTKKNSNILLQYIFDMEQGINISNSSRKGGRSPQRLNSVRQKLVQIFRMLQERNVKDVTKISREKIMEFFNDMRNGKILTSKGTKYKATVDYVKAFKAFWNWYRKMNRLKANPIIITDITEDIDSKYDEKPKWVYLDENQMSRLLKNTVQKYVALFEFMYDSGARVTESFSLRGKDITKGKKDLYVNISYEIAKSTGRKIKLKLCGESLLSYIKENKIEENDYLFPFSAPVVNRYLKELCKKLFGDKVSKAGDNYSKFTLYDFRHNSSCFWLQRYKTNSMMMYRFGWKSEKYIHYYSEFLGMKDEIRDEDMYVDITKTELEKEIEKLKKSSKAQNKLLHMLAKYQLSQLTEKDKHEIKKIIQIVS